jgi:hypothetical protein
VLIILPQLLLVLDRPIAATDLDKHIIKRWHNRKKNK